MKLKVTDAAADAIFKALINQPKSGLRVGIRGGGCSGLSYVLELDDHRETDIIIKHDGAEVYVDPKSAVFLEDCVLDYTRGLMESGFKISNPKVKHSCGCGESFSL